MLDKLEKKFDANTFAMAVEGKVRTLGMGYLEAILSFCEENDMEPTAIGNLVKKSDVIKSKLEAECRELNLLERTAKLPI
jgi:hypothetical protein